MSRIQRFLFATSVAAFVGGCASADRPPVTPAASRFAALDATTLRIEVDKRIADLNLDAVQRAQLDERFDALVVAPDFIRAMETVGVQAVGTIRLGEGGALVKFGSGSGHIAFSGQDPRPFSVRARGIGASIGGSAIYGIVVVAGVADARSFPGTYRGRVASATAIRESTGALHLRHQRRGHDLFVVGVSSGLSANAGATKLVLAYTP